MYKLKIFSYLPNPRVWKSLIAGKICGVEIEVVGVTIVWPGASAEDVDVNIVEPLQAQLRFLAGVDELESRS